MRIAMALLFLLVSTASQAAMMVVNTYQPLPGKGPLTASYLKEAQTMLREMGYQVFYSTNPNGNYSFNMYFESWEGYGAMYEALGASPTYAAFIGKISANPSATQVDHLRLNEVRAAPGGAVPGSVSQVTVWNVPLNERAAFMPAVMGAVPHHERQGAAGVSVWADGFNVYYVTHHENMSAMGRFQDTPNPAFQQYFAEQTAEANSAITMTEQMLIIVGQ